MRPRRAQEMLWLSFVLCLLLLLMMMGALRMELAAILTVVVTRGEDRKSVPSPSPTVASLVTLRPPHVPVVVLWNV